MKDDKEEICVGPITIVEYNPALARQLADMWNRSGDNWGGFSSVMTELMVLDEQAASSALHVYLAMDGDEVVGYCSLFEYREDEGSLYIQTLNVRPDYHNRKIGKMLVLECVKRTVELGWPRLDLYTWPGNTKAVPLYKKCGFFWERRDDTTHLMNFIPTVLTTEAVRDFFTRAHWYEDAKRVIQIEPDGRLERDYDLYEYLWEKDGETLRMEFERRGRGLRLIETDDYLISASVEAQQVIFGRGYSVTFEAVNRSGKPLCVEIRGCDDKNIRFDLAERVSVSDRVLVKGTFFVDEIKEEINTFRTQPAVAADLTINGLRASFRLGIIPKFPAKIQLKVPGNEMMKGLRNTLYLDIESSLPVDADFAFNLPSSDAVRFLREEICLSLPAKGRESIAIPYIAEEYTFYEAPVPVNIVMADGERMQFTKMLSATFTGRTGSFGGELDDKWVIVNGAYKMELFKQSNIRRLSAKMNVYNSELSAVYPKLGKPFSSEFSKKRPERVEIFEEGSAMIMRVTYRSEEFAGIEVTSVTKLYGSGVAENWTEVFNTNDRPTDAGLHLLQGIDYPICGMVIPYNGKFVTVTNSSVSEFNSFELSNFTENWLFTQREYGIRGLVWPEGTLRIVYDPQMEHALGVIPALSRVRTEPFYLAVGGFQNWREFRSFALGGKKLDAETVTDYIEVTVNGGNPFVGEEFSVSVADHRVAHFDGEISLTGEMISPAGQFFTNEEAIRVAGFDLRWEKEGTQGRLQAHLDLNPAVYTEERYLFKRGRGSVAETLEREAGLEVWSADNGILRIKAGPDFGPLLYSMTYEGREWLDSSFPKAGPLSWFNPWFGGISRVPRGFNRRSLEVEPRTCEFVEKVDSCGNRWKGIRVNMTIKDVPEYRGLTISHHYLLLPGVPVLCYTTELVQNTGTLLNEASFLTELFVKPDDTDIRRTWFATKDLKGKLIRYKSGLIANDIMTTTPLLFGGEGREEKLYVYQSRNPIAGVGSNNKDTNFAFLYHQVTAEQGRSLYLPPIFFIFTDEYIPEEMLNDLENLRFS